MRRKKKKKFRFKDYIPDKQLESLCRLEFLAKIYRRSVTWSQFRERYVVEELEKFHHSGEELQDIRKFFDNPDDPVSLP